MNKKKAQISDVLIITRHAVPNYGSVLQAIATQKLIEDLGYTASILDYNRIDETPKALSNYYSSRAKSIAYKIYYMTLWRLSRNIVDRQFKRIRNEYLKVEKTPCGMNLSLLFESHKHLVTGSDQVWNIVGSGSTIEIDGKYFWEDAKESSHIISYAASFGDSVITNDDKEKCIQWLKRFSSISVREDSGVKLLKSMGCLGTQVLDPTLVIDSNFWNKLANKAQKIKKHPYALIYNLHSDSNMKEYVKKDLRGTNLNIYNISTTFRKTVGKNIFCPTVEEFLYLFKNAKRVYTDSFHAIAMCIIFKTPFTVVLPQKNSTRLESILRLFNLQDQVNKRIGNDKCAKDSINWSEVDVILKEQREKSIEWLKIALREN